MFYTAQELSASATLLKAIHITNYKNAGPGQSSSHPHSPTIHNMGHSLTFFILTYSWHLENYRGCLSDTLLHITQYKISQQYEIIISKTTMYLGSVHPLRTARSQLCRFTALRGRRRRPFFGRGERDCTLLVWHRECILSHSPCITA